MSSTSSSQADQESAGVLMNLISLSIRKGLDQLELNTSSNYTWRDGVNQGDLSEKERKKERKREREREYSVEQVEVKEDFFIIRMPRLVAVLGDKLWKNGSSGSMEEIETRSINREVVMLYFSAHWCPPCRGFTPVLAQFYERHKDKIEIVFISSDRSPESFNEYYATMPWLALPYDNRDLKNILSRKFQVSGIPTLIFLDRKTGVSFETNGRSVVLSDPDAKLFPWHPPTIEEVLSAGFIQGNNLISNDFIKGKYIGVFFSAAWSQPGRNFTEELVQTYQAIKSAGNNFEIVYVSSDESEEQFDQYRAEMPWVSIPFQDKERREHLSHAFNVSNIPTLILLDSEFHVVNKAARLAVSSDPRGENFPWIPSTVQDILEGVECINNTPTLLFMMENEPASVAAMFDEIQGNISSIFRKAALSRDVMNIMFLSAKSQNPIAMQIRLMCRVQPYSGHRSLCLGDTCVKVNSDTAIIMIDVADGGAFYILDNAELSEAKIHNFVQNFLSGDLLPQRQVINRS